MSLRGRELDGHNKELFCSIYPKFVELDQHPKIEIFNFSRR